MWTVENTSLRKENSRDCRMKGGTSLPLMHQHPLIISQGQ